MGHPTMQENDTAKLTPTLQCTKVTFISILQHRYLEKVS